MSPNQLPERVAADGRFVLAWRTLDVVDEMSMKFFTSRQFRAWAKADGTLVTDMDTTIERLLIEKISATFPADMITGEELGTTRQSTSEHMWFIDPIDASANFIDGIPIYSHMVSHVRNESTVFAIVSAPMLGKRWWAYSGEGAYDRDARITASKTRDLSHAKISYGGLKGYAERLDAFLRLIAACRRSRGFGNFWSHMLVAEGSYDLGSSGSGCHPWDITPLELILREAGGKLSALDGSQCQGDGAILSSNGLLHQQAISLLLEA